jgi:hypothetical protein
MENVFSLSSYTGIGKVAKEDDGDDDRLSQD